MVNHPADSSSMKISDGVPVIEFSKQIACDPQKSVVVSACAGSGKTWLLVARMVRLLLDDVKPQQILALTFTRKAAQEMRDRLYALLQEFSTSDDAVVANALIERGLDASQIDTYLPKAKALYMQVLANPQPIVIDTFHGWFGKLLGAAPVSLGIQPGFTLREDAKRLQKECLEDWWGGMSADLRAQFDVLLKHLGSYNALQLLMGKASLLKQRGAWTFFAKACEQSNTSPIERLKTSLNKLKDTNPLLALWNAPDALERLEFVAYCFEHSGTQDQGLLEYLLPAIACKKRGGDVMDVVQTFQSTFLTKDSPPLNRSWNNRLVGTLETFLINEGLATRSDEYLAIKNEWGQAFVQYLEWQAEQEIYAINQAWFVLNESMMAHTQDRKENMRVRDFDDLEIGVSLLMADSAHAAYLQSRLDARYTQILVDEFQDTNPLQWQILRSWLDGYGNAPDKPKVFIVGDPKQSIYRFRRADPRLFVSAKQFLHSIWGAVYMEQGVTRRNAPQINRAVNAIFTGPQIPSDYPYSEQQTSWRASDQDRPIQEYAQQGEAFLLPLLPYETKGNELRSGSAFDSAIIDPYETVNVAQRHEEGLRVGRLISHLIATRKVADKDGDQDIWRSARASDFLLLVKRRQYLPQYERALRDMGLVYDSSRLGGLLNTLEVDDLIALLSVLVTPRHDLPLAQVLRSPIFGFTEQQMQKLAIAKTPDTYRSWWDALQDSADPSLQEAARYLKHWHELSERLPVHDLLDRIYQERDVRMRYATVCQDRDRAQVLANLDAFLMLSLDQDGGQYPSLSRFINEINAKRRGDDDETPDEGEIDAITDDNLVEADQESDLSDEDQHLRVRLMTIHGAKGLESPFVIVLDANNTKANPDKIGVLMDWPPHEKGPLHLSAFNTKTLTSPRSEINEAEKAIGINENWNLLYVAMTRARQGLWISGDAQKPTANNPTGLNEESWYGRASSAGLTVDLVVENTLAETQNAPRAPQVTSTTVSIDDFVLEWPQAINHHAQLVSDIEAGITVDVFAGEDETITQSDSELLQEGTNFHRLLEFLIPDSGNQAKPPMPSEQELINWMSIDQEQAKDLILRAKTILETSELKPYLALGEWVAAWNELDIATVEGKGYRIDRLIEFEDHFAILDYKLSIPQKGSPLHQKYLAQLQIYQTQLSRIREDKPSKAYLVSAAGELVEMNATP